MSVARKTLASLCCAAGGLFGLWRGMLAVPTESPSPHAWTALADVMQPVAIGVAVGVTAGALLAAAVCASVPRLRLTRDRA